MTKDSSHPFFSPIKKNLSLGLPENTASDNLYILLLTASNELVSFSKNL
jgi:hypothetical protein